MPEAGNRDSLHVDMSEKFWDFSLRTYGTVGVPEACLVLQDQRGLDVNMLLFCCWFGLTRGPIEARDLDQVLDFSLSWATHVVRPLRQVRTWMKSEACLDPRLPTEACMAYREKIKALELGGEKMQQEVLASLAASIPHRDLVPPRQLDAMVANLYHYLAALTIDADDVVRKQLAIILQAGAPVLSRSVIDRALEARG